MYRANEHGLPMLVASVSPDVRAMLAKLRTAMCGTGSKPAARSRIAAPSDSSTGRLGTALR